MSILHHVAEMLERSVFRPLFTGRFFESFWCGRPYCFTGKAFLSLACRIVHWTGLFLIHRTQVVKCDNVISSSQPINVSIVHWSGLGPMLHVVMAKTLRLFHLLTDCLNMLMTPLYCPVIQMLVWRPNSKMSSNGLKTTKWSLILLKPRRLSLGAQTQDFLSTQVLYPILLGLVLTERLHFDDHVSAVAYVRGCICWSS